MKENGDEATGPADRLQRFGIGSRDNLSKQEARRAAKAWREAVQLAPKAIFVLHLAGFDEDPREIWEIVEAARYVRWWARYAGMDDIETDPEASAEGDRENSMSLGFLAACGVFGEEMRR